MSNFSRPNPCREVLLGDIFSVFLCDDDSYWVFSNKQSSLYAGPYDFASARMILTRSNEIYSFNVKGGLFYE